MKKIRAHFVLSSLFRPGANYIAISKTLCFSPKRHAQTISDRARCVTGKARFIDIFCARGNLGLSKSLALLLCKEFIFSIFEEGKNS